MTIESQIALPMKEIPRPQAVAWIMIVRTEPELAILASERANTAGLITFPGGKVESGETPTSCVVRELYEETTVRIEPDEIYTAGNLQTIAAADGTFVTAHPFFAFAGSIHNQIISNEEPSNHNSWNWLSVTEIVKSVTNGKLPANFDLNFFLKLTELIFETEYEFPSSSRTSHILNSCAEYNYENALKSFQRNILGDHATMSIE